MDSENRICPSCGGELSADGIAINRKTPPPTPRSVAMSCLKCFGFYWQEPKGFQRQVKH
jgi:uncharacterized protein with PIN domain